MLLAWLLAGKKRSINWKLIVWGILFQFIFALFMFKVPAGRCFFLFLNDFVIKILDAATFACLRTECMVGTFASGGSILYSL